MSIVRGSFVMINVPEGRDPLHGWAEGYRNGDLCFVEAKGSSYCNIYNHTKARHSMDTKELVPLINPFEATYACLGKGVVKAVFDVPTREEAVKLANDFMTDANLKDAAARTIDKLPWINNQADLKPILLGVEDKKPVMETLRSLVWKGRG